MYNCHNNNFINVLGKIKHSLFVWLFVSSVKTGTRRIIRPDELSSVVPRSSRTTVDSSSGRITLSLQFAMRLNLIR